MSFLMMCVVSANCALAPLADSADSARLHTEVNRALSELAAAEYVVAQRMNERAKPAAKNGAASASVSPKGLSESEQARHEAAVKRARALLDTVIFLRPWGPSTLTRMRAEYPGSMLLDRYDAALLVRQGNDTAALMRYSTLLRKTPQDPELHLAQGAILQRIGKPKDAIVAYERALDLDPENSEAYQSLLSMHDQSKSFDKLLGQIRRLRARRPESSVLREHEIELLHRLGRLKEAGKVAREDSIASARLSVPSSKSAESSSAFAASGSDTNTEPSSTNGGGESAVATRTASRSALSGLWDFSRQQLDSRLSGELTTISELYAHNGAEARRPGQSWRVQYNPQLSLIGGVSVSVNMLLSSEGSQLRQNINQAGFTPKWSWGSLSVGDFSNGYSAYTTQGLRVRGAGVDLTPGIWRVAVQGGRTQRAVSSLTAGPVFQRNMIAAKVGMGSEGGRFIDMTVLKAKDNVNSVERVLLVLDPTVLDTLVDEETAEALRPRLNTFNRPQENLVVNVAGQLPLFDNALVIRAEGAKAAITRDLLSPKADPDGLSGVARTVAKAFMPIHLSTSEDAAYNVDIVYTGSRASLRAGYEEVGAGYSSLGLGYLINDRRAYNVAGSIRGFSNRVSLQGQYQHQNDNLLGQLGVTTNRDVLSGALSIRASDAITTTITGFTNMVGNDAAVDTFVVDNRSFSVTSSTALMHDLFGRAASTALSYGIQRTADDNPIRNIPSVTVHNASLSVQLPITKTINVSPTLSAVLTQMSETPTVASSSQRNIFAGIRGQARFLDGKLLASGDVSNTFSNARRVFGVRSNASYELPFGTRLLLQSRFNNYSATPSRRAFSVMFFTTSLTRSF